MDFSSHTTVFEQTLWIYSTSSLDEISQRWYSFPFHTQALNYILISKGLNIPVQSVKSKTS